MTVKKTKVEVYGETSKYERSMRNVQRTSKRTSQTISKQWQLCSGVMGKMFALTSVLGVGSFTMMAKSALETGDKIHKLNLRLGLSTESLSQLQHVASLSGVEFEAVAKSFQKMQENISDSAQGIGTVKDTLEDLGLNSAKLKLLSPEKQLEAIADAMLGVANQSDKVRIAADIFGGRGVQMLQVMHSGAAGIREMRKEADRLGLTLSKDGAQAIADANDAMTRVKNSMAGVTRSLVVELAPAIKGVSDEMAVWVGQNRELFRQQIPEYLGKTKTALSGIWDVVSYDPAIIEYGILGLAIGGKKGAVVGASLGHMKSWAENVSAALGMAAGGIIDFKDVARANYQELAVLVEAGEEKMKRIGSGFGGPVRGKLSPETIATFKEKTVSPKPPREQAGMGLWMPQNAGESILEQHRAVLAGDYEKRLAQVQEFNTTYAELGMSRFDLERVQLENQVEAWRKAGADITSLGKYGAAKRQDITRQENDAKIAMYSNAAGEIANTFMQISQAGGEQSREMFRMYQAFAIINATMSAYLAIGKTLAEPTLPFPSNVIMAHIIGAMAMAQVGMIAGAKPPSYDEGGISTTPGMYYAGIPEAHIPLKSGRVPVMLGRGNVENRNYYVSLEVNAVDAESFAELTSRNPQAIVGPIVEAIGHNDPALRSALNTAVR